MRRQDFSYQLPDDLIARYPTAERTGSRLLSLNGESGELRHRQFTELLDLLNPGDLMVFNDTRVIPARLFGHKDSGGKVEVLVERLLDQFQCLAHIRASKSPKTGASITLEGEYSLKVTGRQGGLFLVESAGKPLTEILEAVGHMPLPPYMEREDTADDQERYQTVYSRQPGAVAAPTAGLHFDEPLLDKIKNKGVEFAYVTLHVGAGTFQPVRVDNISDHQMHSEWLSADQALCDAVNRAKGEGRRIVAVGTTSVRCLETLGNLFGDEPLQPYAGDTDIFIYPGYEFHLVDAMVTNFHLPESTLLMLISAFAGYQQVMQAYKEAVGQRYRFFSYGDAMFITRNPDATGL